MAKIIPSPLYSADQEHDACGVGFIAKLTGERSYDVVNRALTALKALAHRGAIDADAVTGDGAGLLTQLPIEFFKSYLFQFELTSVLLLAAMVGAVMLSRPDRPTPPEAEEAKH